MRTLITVSVDGEIKEKAMQIIQIRMKSTLSAEVDKLLHKIVEKHSKKEGRDRSE